MQKQIREEGHTGMSPDVHASFVAEHESGRLLNPDQPGTVIAKLAIGATNALTGKHYRYEQIFQRMSPSLTSHRWNAAELADFQSK